MYNSVLIILFFLSYFIRSYIGGKTKSNMSNQNTNPDIISSGDFDKPSLPSGLNVLTILTFIGSGIYTIFSLTGFLRANKTFEEKDKVIAQMNNVEMPGWIKSFMPTPEYYEVIVTKSYENKIPLLILGLVAIALCVYGAMEMRKLKKQGFLFYLIGQVLPFISSALFIGIFTVTEFGSIMLLSVSVLFILFYLTQKKHLIY